jgi:hypothetical protein
MRIRAVHREKPEKKVSYLSLSTPFQKKKAPKCWGEGRKDNYPKVTDKGM